MYFKKLITLAIAAAYAVQTTAADNIYETAAKSEDFTTLADAIKLAGLDDELSGNGPFTVFAPSDSAFDELPEELVTKLLDPVWKPQLQNVLLYHVIPGEVRSTNLADGMTATTIIGEDITINLDPARVNNVTISTADIDADNGVIHGIDGVLTPVSVTSNVIDIIAGDDQFTTLLMALKLAGLDLPLMGDGPFTVFAPTNDAFDALPLALVDMLLLPANIEQLTNVLKYHVVTANADSPSLTSGDIETLNGKSVEVDVSDMGITVGVANFVGPDMIAINGIIHAIDTVLMPPADIVAEPEEESTEPTEPEGEATEPEEEETEPMEELTEPEEETIEPEEETTEPEEESTEPDEELTGPEEETTEPEEETAEPEEESTEPEDETTEPDEELTGPEEETTEPEEETAEPEEEPANEENIVDIAAGDDRFTTLVKAVTAAGLAGALSGEGPFTVFAPTNDAFAALPEGTVESLLLPENVGALTDILKYHVVEANAPSTSLTSGEIETLNGDSVNVAVSDGGVTVNGANVIIPDIIASNGIIHVIDAVLIPPSDEPAEVTEESASIPKPTKMPSMLPLFPKSAKVFTKTAKGSKSSKATKGSKLSKATKGSKSSKATINVVPKSSKATKVSKASEAAKAFKASKSVKSGKTTKTNLFH